MLFNFAFFLGFLVEKVFRFEAFVELTCMAASAALQPREGISAEWSISLEASAGPGASEPQLVMTEDGFCAVKGRRQN